VSFEKKNIAPTGIVTVPETHFPESPHIGCLYFEMDKMVARMSHIGSETDPNNAVPHGAVTGLDIFLDIAGYITLLNILLYRILTNVNHK